jgi:hypothetical protein
MLASAKNTNFVLSGDAFLFLDKIFCPELWFRKYVWLFKNADGGESSSAFEIMDANGLFGQETDPFQP